MKSKIKDVGIRKNSEPSNHGGNKRNSFSLHDLKNNNKKIVQFASEKTARKFAKESEMEITTWC